MTPSHGDAPETDERSCRLSLEDGTELVDPEAEQVDGLLGFLGGPGNRWARLEGAFGRLRTERDPAYHFTLHWVAAGEEGVDHLRTVSDSLSLDDVRAAFRDCAAGDEGWQAELLWQPDFRSQLVEVSSPHRSRLESSVQSLTLQIVQEAGELPARLPWHRLQKLAARMARRVSRELAEEEERFRLYRRQLEDDVHQALLELLQEAIDRGDLAEAIEEMEDEG